MVEAKGPVGFRRETGVFVSGQAADEGIAPAVGL
jgi:hypothetical protein